MSPKGGPSEEERLAALMDRIEKQHGTGTIRRLGDSSLPAIDTFSSGSIALDEALGVGGISRGRVIEIYGPESSGKTSLALTAMGNAQRQGLRVAIIDAENALDPEWASVLGVNTDDLYVSQPDNGEQGLGVVAELVASGLYGVITVDSVAALVPKKELEGEIGDSHVGLQARMMSQGLRMLTGAAANTGTTIMFINQLREKVGVFFGSNETQPGGKALKFYSSVRLDVRRIQTIKNGTEPVGSKVRVKVVKNKLAAPFKVAEFDFYFGEGISRTAELLDLGVERGVAVKAGSVYRVPGHDKALVGKDAARKWLADNPVQAQELEKLVRAAPPVPARPRRSRDEGLDMEGPAPWEDGESAAGD